MPSPLHQFDILVIDFPFLDQERIRLRPVVIISSTAFIQGTGIASIAMITRLNDADQQKLRSGIQDHLGL